MQLSRYEDVAQSFLDAFPVGTMISGDEIVDWIEEKADGHVIRSDLRIDDPRKKISAVRRHLNDGGRSSNVTQDRRFVVDVEDAKRLSFAVVAYAQFAHARATQAFVRSAGAAIAPLNSAIKIGKDQKLDELTAEERARIERDLRDLEAIKEPVRKAYAEETDRRMVTALVERGQTLEQARSLLASMQILTPYQKLLRKLA
jgi:hypothetical protein